MKSTKSEHHFPEIISRVSKELDFCSLFFGGGGESFMLIYYRDYISPKHCSLKFWSCINFLDPITTFDVEQMNMSKKLWRFFMIPGNQGTYYVRKHIFFKICSVKTNDPTSQYKHKVEEASENATIHQSPPQKFFIPPTIYSCPINLLPVSHVNSFPSIPLLSSSLRPS